VLGQISTRSASSSKSSWVHERTRQMPDRAPALDGIRPARNEKAPRAFEGPALLQQGS